MVFNFIFDKAKEYVLLTCKQCIIQIQITHYKEAILTTDHRAPLAPLLRTVSVRAREYQLLSVNGGGYNNILLILVQLYSPSTNVNLHHMDQRPECEKIAKLLQGYSNLIFKLASVQKVWSLLIVKNSVIFLSTWIFFFQSKSICDVVQILYDIHYRIYTVSVHNLNDYHFLAPFTLLISANSSTLKHYDSTKSRREWIALNFERVNLCTFTVVN